MGRECPECRFIEDEYAKADSDDLTRDGLLLALAANKVAHNKSIDWYQQRFKAIRKWVNTEVRPLSEEAANRYFSIVANGSPAPHEQADWRETMHGLTMRAEHAERELADRVKECEELRDYAENIGMQAVIDAEVTYKVVVGERDIAESALARARSQISQLSEFVIDDADNDCHYGDNCPSNAGTRHGTCRSCEARQTLAACGVHVWFEHDDLEACRNCGVVRREDDGNKPCKGKVALALR